MRVVSVALAMIIASIGAASAEDLQGFIQNKSAEGLSFKVVDNGAAICDVAPEKSCTWPMEKGFHRVELTRSDGAQIWGDYEVTDKNAAPNTPIEDCDFKWACPVEAIDQLAPDPTASASNEQSEPQ